MPSPSEGKKSPQLFRTIGLVTSIPMVLVAGPLVGYLIGQWCDRRFGTAPYLLITFVICGFIGAAREVYQILRRLSREDE